MLECLVCHKSFLSLPMHIIKMHKMTIQKYRKIYNYTGNLQSDEFKEKLKNWHKYNDHPLLGTHLSEDEKKNLSFKIKGKFKQTEEAKIKIGMRRGEKHHAFGKKFTRLHRDRLSISHAEYYKNKKSRITTSYGEKGNYTSTKSNKVYHYESSWERKVMLYLDHSERITDWVYEPFYVKYVDEYGFNRRYTPDFLITLDHVIRQVWEVKPSFKFRDHDVGFCRFYCKLEGLEQYLKEHQKEIRSFVSGGVDIVVISDIEFNIINNFLKEKGLI